MTIIWISAGAVALLGLLLGVALGVAGKFFSVEKDERVDAVRQLLPGANCGACGFPGCDGLASAIVTEGAAVNACTVNTADNAKKIAELMGADADGIEPLIAHVQCRGTLDNTQLKFHYEGLSDCAAAMSVADGTKSCPMSCLGFGNCARVCPVDAITIINGLSTIDHSRCITCGKCVAECPRHIIRLLPKHSVVRIDCSNVLKGKAVSDNCKVGCIGCSICARSCRYDAITMVNDLPVFDYKKCVGCMECAKKCPRQIIWNTGGKETQSA